MLPLAMQANVREGRELGRQPLLLGFVASGAAMLVCLTVGIGIVASQGQEFQYELGNVTLWVVPLALLALGFVVALECLATGVLALLLTAGYILGGNDFAKIALVTRPVPVYVGEGVLVASFAFLLVRSMLSAPGRGPRVREYHRLLWWLSGLYVVGLVQALRGMEFSTVEALRDASIFYYSAWLLFVPLVVRSSTSIERVMLFMLATVAGLALLRVGKGTLNLQILENQAPISRDLFLGTAIIVGGMLIGRLQGSGQIMMLALMALATYWVVVEHVRAVWVGLAVGMSYACWMLWRSEEKAGQALWVISGIIGIGVLLLVGLSVVEPEGFQEITDELSSIVLFNSAPGEPGENARVRIEMWTDVVKAFPDFAIAGIGFGTPFFLDSLEARGFTDPNPERAGMGRDPIHNSILEIGLRTGLIGLVFFAGVLRLYFSAASHAVRVLSPGRLRALTIGIHGSVVMVLVASCFAPLLQVPYIAVPLWLGMGLVIAALNTGVNERKPEEQS